jgi:hypothetical protein
MNVVPRYALRLIAMTVFLLASSHLAVASDTASGPTFRLAMGPMSAAQKNQGQGTAATSGEGQTRPHHRIRHRRIHHTR